MARAGLVANYNNIPFDPRPPMDPSGVRLGAAAVTSRGFGPEQMRAIAQWMVHVGDNLEDEAALDAIAGEVRALCAAFPAPGLETPA